MTLNQIAQQAMGYLDSVGVAADYRIFDGGKIVVTAYHFDKYGVNFTNQKTFGIENIRDDEFMKYLKRRISLDLEAILTGKARRFN